MGIFGHTSQQTGHTFCFFISFLFLFHSFLLFCCCFFMLHSIIHGSPIHTLTHTGFFLPPPYQLHHCFFLNVILYSPLTKLPGNSFFFFFFFSLFSSNSLIRRILRLSSNDLPLRSREPHCSSSLASIRIRPCAHAYNTCSD